MFSVNTQLHWTYAHRRAWQTKQNLPSKPKWLKHCLFSTPVELADMGSEISHKHCHSHQPWRWHWQKPWLCCSLNTQGSSCSQQKLNPLPILLTLHCDGLTRRGWRVEGLLRLITSNKPPTWRMLVALCQIHKLWLNFSASSSSSFLKPGPFHPIRRFPRGE